MKIPVKVLVTTLVLGILAFLASPNGPLGGFWPPTPQLHQPTGGQVPLFILLGAAEALALGAGVSFLIFGFPQVRAIGPVSMAMARATHLSIAWFLINWWLHDGLHIHYGLDLNPLLAIEYAFHFTLIVAGAIVACFFLALLRQTAPAPQAR